MPTRNLFILGLAEPGLLVRVSVRVNVAQGSAPACRVCTVRTANFLVCNVEEWQPGRTGHLAYRACARWAVQYWGCLGPLGALKYTKHRPAAAGVVRFATQAILGQLGASLGQNAMP